MQSDTTGRARRSWLIGTLSWLVLAAITATALWQMRRDAIENQGRELTLLSLAVTDGVDRGLRGVDEGLQTLQAELRYGKLPLATPEAGPALATRVGLMPLVEELWLVDKDGRRVAAADDTPPPSLSDFQPPLAQLPVGSVALARFGDHAEAGGWRVAVAAAFNDPVHGQSGWLLAAMPQSALLGAFGTALPSADARLWVVRADGARLAGANVQPSGLDEAEVDVHLASSPELAVRRFRDGSDNLVATHGVSRYGLKVLVSRDLSAALAPWRHTAEAAMTALALLLAVMAAAVYGVARADRRHAEAERALQAQRARASKLVSLGTLAGGVAHDFNNVLAGIVGFGEMAQDAAAPGSAQARHLQKMLQAALRGKTLVERILAFSSSGARASVVFELQPVVEEVLNLLSATLRPGLVLERSLEAPGAALRGDATQAFQAVLNLCQNAMQAMPDGGMLSVHLKRFHAALPGVLSHTRLAPGDYLSLVVSDQGGGISAPVMEHLFEPFFTTRGAQSGSGLGLAVVFGVVAEFGGAIDVHSGSGQGARFTLYLPECKDAPAAPEPVVPAVAAGGGQRLMVVDDEPELVELATEMLVAQGYRVAGYTDAGAALAALHADPAGFAALITDEVMPGLSGTQLTATLRARHPHLPVLLVSGYGGASLAERAQQAGVSRVLAKPLQRAQLARALAELLG